MRRLLIASFVILVALIAIAAFVHERSDSCEKPSWMEEYPQPPAAYVPDSKGVYHKVDVPPECNE